MPRNIGSDNPEEFEKFVSQIPEECRDVSRKIMAIARELTDMDVKFLLGFSTSSHDAACAHNLRPGDEQSVGRMLMEIMRGLRDANLPPPGFLVIDTEEE